MTHYNLYAVKKKSNIKLSILALVLAFAMTAVMSMLSTVSAEDNVKVVTGNTVTSNIENDSEGWWFNRDPRTKTPYQFTTNEASIGAGSLYVEPITNSYTDEPGKLGNDKFIAENFVWQSVDTLESISYDFMISGTDKTPADATHFYLNAYVNLPTQTDVNNYYDCRFDFTPTALSVDTWTTAEFTKTSSPTHVRPRGGATCPTTLAGLPSGSTIRMFSISVGDTSANDTGLAGYLDNVVLATTGDTTIYDFEPALDNKEQCKKGGYEAFGFKNQGQCIQFVNTGKDARNR